MITNKTQIDNNTYEVEFSASADQLKIEKQRVYLKEVRKYNVPGFRKGKAPLSVIERMYGPVFTQEAVETVYQSAIDEAIAEFGMEVVDANSGEVVSLEGDVAFKAKFVVKPEVKIDGYKGLSVEVHVHHEHGLSVIAFHIGAVFFFKGKSAYINSIAGLKPYLFIFKVQVEMHGVLAVKSLDIKSPYAFDICVEKAKLDAEENNSRKEYTSCNIKRRMIFAGLFLSSGFGICFL